MSAKLALIIANTEYTDTGLAQLTAPGKDAKDFGQVLDSPEFCAFDDVLVLVNETSYKVGEAIDHFLSNRKPDDLVLLYFSGHGIRDEYGSLYLAVKNTNRARLRSTAIKSDFIREAMDQSRSRRQVLILDCCNSGAFAQGTKAATGVSIGTASVFEAGYGRIILTASDSTQYAWEGDKVIGETDNSLFTHFLVEGLEGRADLNGDGQITVDELYEYAYEKVKIATPKQTPSKFSSKQQGEIILRENMRIEDIKFMPLPAELINAIENPLPFVREGAVRQLDGILKGKNIGLARSAREALERMEREDDSRRVSQAATQVLELIRQAEKAEEESKAAEEVERIAAQKAEAERIALKKAETEQWLAQQKAEEERKPRNEAERLAALKAKEERLAREKEEAEDRTRAEAQRLANENAEEAERKARQLEIQKNQSQPLEYTKASEESLTLEHRETTFLSSQHIWMTIGWAIAGAIGGVTSVSSSPIFGGAVGVAIGGLVTAIALQNENSEFSSNGLFGMALAWAVGGAAGWWIADYMGEATGATFGFGFGAAISITILILVVGFVSFDWKNLAWILLAWAISGRIGWSIAKPFLYEGLGTEYTSSWAIGIGIGWGIAGFVMGWQLLNINRGKK